VIAAGSSAPRYGFQRAGLAAARARGFMATNSAGYREPSLLDLAYELPISDRERPKDLLDALHRTARLQAVKCVPRRDRSKPTSAMEQTCSTFLLEEELEILQPQLILNLGSVPDAAISRLSRYEHLESTSSEYLWRHRLARKWGLGRGIRDPPPRRPPRRLASRTRGAAYGAATTLGARSTAKLTARPSRAAKPLRHGGPKSRDPVWEPRRLDHLVPSTTARTPSGVPTTPAVAARRRNPARQPPHARSMESWCEELV
jgi:hypothetical protein